jgi:Mg2+ and Co2+ transporter CorA
MPHYCVQARAQLASANRELSVSRKYAQDLQDQCASVERSAGRDLHMLHEQLSVLLNVHSPQCCGVSYTGVVGGDRCIVITAVLIVTTLVLVFNLIFSSYG